MRKRDSNSDTARTTTASRPADVDNILVPIDAHESSTAAVRLAAMLADALGASIAIMHLEITEQARRKVLEIDRRSIASIDDATLAKFMQTLLGRYSPNSFDDIEFARERIDPATHSVAAEICTAATEMDADLVVIPMRHHTALEKFVRGGIVEQVLDHAPCPITVIP